MRVWKFGDHVPAHALVDAAERLRLSQKQKAIEVDRRMIARFVAAVAEAEDDLLLAGFDFGTGPSADALARFLNASHVRAVVAKSFAPEFAVAASSLDVALIAQANAVDTYEQNEYLPPDDCLIRYILEAGPDAMRRVPEVELDLHEGRLVIDGTPFTFAPPVHQT